ncbi:putative Flp pilus-assembly TadE/G-like protein [anaerobic digester metagenome]
MKIVKKILKEEDGQALVLVALMMVVLIGFAAIAVDIGMVTWQKSNLQNAADAAALAGAMDLPNKTSAEDSALDLAGKNGIKATKIGI